VKHASHLHWIIGIGLYRKNDDNTGRIIITDALALKDVLKIT
jgi:hypothetical protein